MVDSVVFPFMNSFTIIRKEVVIMRYSKQMMDKYPLSVYSDDMDEWFAIDTINTNSIRILKRDIHTHIVNGGGDLSIVTHNENIKRYMDSYIHKVYMYTTRVCGY